MITSTRHGALLALAAAAALGQIGAVRRPEDDLFNISEAPETDDAEMLRAIGNMRSLDYIPASRIPGRRRGHWASQTGKTEKALEKRRAANVLARKARRAERLHRHTATGRKALARASA